MHLPTYSLLLYRRTQSLTFDDRVEAGAQPPACDHGGVHRLGIPPDELRSIGTHAALRQRVVTRRRLCIRMSRCRADAVQVPYMHMHMHMHMCMNMCMRMCMCMYVV